MSFDRLAPHYRWMELVLAGKKLHKSRTHFLNVIPRPFHILLLGEGPGRTLVECIRRFPATKVTCLDSSREMLAQAQIRAEDFPVTYLHLDIFEWSPPSHCFDLIISNFFLDCFTAEQLNKVIEKVFVASRPGATWLIADFQIAAQGWKKLRSQAILGLMYAFFRIATRLPAQRLTAPDPILLKNGFTLKDRATSEWGLLRSDWWIRKAE